MTAIAGIFRFDGQPVEAETLRRMIEPVQHRGVGTPAIFTGGRTGLAQVGMPATSPAGSPAVIGSGAGSSVVGVFDGRLDDVFSLKKHLGIEPAVELNDIDLVLAAYHRWGESAPEHLAGDFSFLIFDRSNDSLLCARDPIGTRMLNYCVTDNSIYFATEIKQLFAVAGISAELDEEMLALFLCGAAQYGELTMYRGVKRLKGGHRLMASGNSFKTHSFWDIRGKDQIRHKDQREYAEQFRDLLIRSVNDRLRGEGPVVIELSGGLDSGSVACIAGASSPSHGRELKAVYFQQSNPEFDELPFAEEICSQYGIELTTIDADDHWAMKPDLLAETRDEPFIVPFELLNQKALQIGAEFGSRMVMTGEGGDEAFAAGYMLYLRDWLRHGRFDLIFRELRNGSPQHRRDARKFLRQHLMPGVARRVLNRYRTTVPPWLTNDFRNRTQVQTRLEATLGSSYMDRNYFSGRGSHPFHMLWDHRAASFGMEPAHPLWDLRIVEFLSLIPPAVRLQGGRGKHLLKQALQGIITPGLLTRQSFAAMGRLYERGWREESSRMQGSLARSPLKARGLIDSADVSSRLEAYLAGDDAKLARLFWTLVTDEWLLDRYPAIEAKAGAVVRDAG